MKCLALDTEVTTHAKGNPFNRSNYLVCSSWTDSDGSSGCTRGVEGVQALVDNADLIVGFNLKFDMHWLRKEGIGLSTKRLWDCQVAEFIISNQTLRFPSLDYCAEKYLGKKKLDVVATEYWDKGINTDQVPWEILSEYAELDAKLTLEVFQAQWNVMTASQRRLMSVQMQDTHILAEMEWNGLLYDQSLCQQRAQEIDTQIKAITERLSSKYPDVPINFNSGDHLSAFLYGGIVKQEVRTLIGYFKTGAKIGQPRYRVDVVEHLLPRIVQPIKGSELKKEGIYATSEDVLRKLKGGKKYIEDILELSRLDKLNGTYYTGLQKLGTEMNWEEGVLHGQLNQCVAATGRLSASKPNQQNFASEMQDVFISRFKD